MKHLPLTSSSYEYLELAFKEWLQILGHSEMSAYNMPSIIREFFHYLERQGCHHIQQLKQQHYRDYFTYISSRPNKRRGGGLSNNYLNKHIQALEKFHEFLIYKGNQNVPPVALKQLKLNKSNVTVLTESEVKQLYTATLPVSDTPKSQAIASRDKAMLTVFYGCGLRRNEGVHLDVGDVNFDRRTLHVRKGKNNKERLVPFSEAGAKYLQEWIYDYRSLLVKSPIEGRLFISYAGKPMLGDSLYTRLKLLQLQTEDLQLQQKNIGLHTLRHSIATHLLQRGMPLQNIQRFLGHSSLESTQRYTHLIQEG